MESARIGAPFEFVTVSGSTSKIKRRICSGFVIPLASGWRNPFAALWGVLDRDDVLWIGNERYLRETPLHEHARALLERCPKAMWYANPAGRTEEYRYRHAVVGKAATEVNP